MVVRFVSDGCFSTYDLLAIVRGDRPPTLKQAQQSLQLTTWFCASTLHPRLQDLLELCDEQARVAARIQALGILPILAGCPTDAARVQLDLFAEAWPETVHPLLGWYARLHEKRLLFLRGPS